MEGKEGALGTVPLHNLQSTSHVLHQDVSFGLVPKYFFLCWGISRGPGEGEGAPGTVNLHNAMSLRERHVEDTLRIAVDLATNLWGELSRFYPGSDLA